jgi:hypothetical protein
LATETLGMDARASVDMRLEAEPSKAIGNDSFSLTVHNSMIFNPPTVGPPPPPQPAQAGA